MDEPRPTTADAATRGAGELHRAIGRIGDGDLAGALRPLQSLTKGGAAVGHAQEGYYYTGVALAEGGLPILAGRAFAGALDGQDESLARAAAARLADQERTVPGIGALLDVSVDGPTPPALGAVVGRAEMVLAARSARSERGREAVDRLDRLLESGSDGGAPDELLRRAALVRASPELEPDAARARALLEQAASGAGPGADAARMAAARLAFGQGDLEQALTSYRLVGPGSPWHATAQTEALWTLVRLDRPKAALDAYEALAAGEPADVPPGASLAAALVHHQACATDRADALVAQAEARLSADARALDDAMAGRGTRLRAAVAEPVDADLARLLLLPSDRWVAGVLAGLRAERQALAEPGRPGASPLAATPEADALLGELTRAARSLDDRLREGLARRAAHERESVRRWLRIALRLRHAVLERRKEAIRARLSGADEAKSPEGCRHR